jgi:hypothetical protein
MELVSANTRNFLFLTLSQYNETRRDVRCRVSMRRDTAFWEGGNSFIACESFRISSAPSAGGLYYNKITPDFYMSAEQSGEKPTGSVWTPSDAEILKTGAVGNMAADQMIGRQCITYPASKHHPTKPDPSVSTFLGVTSTTMDHKVQTTLDHLSRYFNPLCITKNSLICLQNTDAPYNNGSDEWFMGRVEQAPSHRVQGAGIGPANLFMPLCHIQEATKVSAEIKAANGGNFATASLFFYNKDIATASDPTFIQNVDALIKIGAFLHYNGPATINDVTNNGQEAFTILGPQSIMTDATVPNDIFETDPNGVKGLIRPITWVGRQPDTMKVATGDLSVPEFWTNKQHKYVDCDITQWHSSYIRKASMVDPNDQHNTLYGCVADVRIHGSALG